MKLLVDTNTLIDLVAGGGNAETLGRADKVLLPIPALGEFVAGLDSTRRGRAARAGLARFLAIPTVETVSLTTGTAECYGTVFRQLKKAGTPIPTNDIWIAALALEHGAVLVSDDAHFQRVANLRILPGCPNPD